MVEPSSGRMLLTQSSGAWPQSRQVAIVPSWAQQAGPHSLIVDSAQFLNVEEIYPKHVQIQKYETKKQDSPIHHLVVPRHDKKETNQLSPVKKRVKENTPPHHYHNHHMNQQHQMQMQPRYNNNHRSSHHQQHQQHQISPPHQAPPPQQYHTSSNSFYGGPSQNAGQPVYEVHNNAPYSGGHGGGKPSHHQHLSQTITIHDTPSPTAIITISDSEDEPTEVLQNKNSNGHRISSSSSCRSNNNQSHGQYNNASTSTCNKLSGSNSVISHNPSSSGSQRHRKNVISCVTVGDSDNEDVSKTPKHNTGKSH